MPKRPTLYDKGQHELVCEALGVSPDPKAPGPSAFEAVCLQSKKLKIAIAHLEKHGRKKDQRILQYIRGDFDGVDFIIPIQTRP